MDGMSEKNIERFNFFFAAITGFLVVPFPGVSQNDRSTFFQQSWLKTHLCSIITIP